MSDIKIINTRNPFQRLVSAWRDKFNKNINPRRQGFFLPSIRTFETGYEFDDKYSCSFEAFISYRAANPSEFCNNRHWRSVYWECSFCHFNYDMILHLEEVHKEYDYVWEKIGPIKPVMEGQYKTSPLADHHPSYFWKKVPRDVAKKIYMIYFMDLVALGYDPEDCLKYINAGPKDTTVLSEETVNEARARLTHGDLFKNQSFLNEVCY
ncbi:unnamed protein product [Oikopleura dioica]|uniref:Carbohydrate sulfotransferase n=1 Tax=Oikopleura dioica TaxID=34765 RepID=E4X1H1_OIKDI|nr:unnamed protein product [Oikopleura dioica]CBY32013.1 unnamed protein product [Oikopleura dioica]